MAFLEFAHILLETTKPKIVLTYNKSVTGFYKREQFHHRCGMQVTTCGNLNWKQHTLQAQSTKPLTFSAHGNLKLGRRQVSKSGKTYSQHQLWRHLHRTSLTKSKVSSPKQTTRMSQRNRPLQEKNNPGKLKKNG